MTLDDLGQEEAILDLEMWLFGSIHDARGGLPTAHAHRARQVTSMGEVDSAGTVSNRRLSALHTSASHCWSLQKRGCRAPGV